ncbi:MAG TPA: hypothetical protein VL866_05375 [Pyrinomonadaceae bacterium]|nr:hypothetical protein [Pyrinomonadaceae bacterium]
MKIPAIRFVLVLALITTACMSTGISGNFADPELGEIAAYRQWDRLTKTPIPVNNASFAG